MVDSLSDKKSKSMVLQLHKVEIVTRYVYPFSVHRATCTRALYAMSFFA